MTECEQVLLDALLALCGICMHRLDCETGNLHDTRAVLAAHRAVLDRVDKTLAAVAAIRRREKEGL